MPLANVALTDSFDTWRIRTNQIIISLDQTNTYAYGVESKSYPIFDKANAANLLAFNTSIGSNAWANVISTRSNNYTNLISSYSNTWANTVGASANARTLTIASYSNTYAALVGTSANAYAERVGASANSGTNINSYNYSNTVAGYSNTWANTVGSSGNIFATTVTAYANNYANVASGRANSWANTVGSSANNYANYTAVSANQFASLTSSAVAIGANTWANTVGIGANNFAVASLSRANTSFQNTAGTLNGSLTVSGSITATGDITAFSDARLKENIVTISDPLTLVKQLRGVTFDWIESGKHSYGLIAQEVEQVLPELVVSVDGGVEGLPEEQKVKTIDYSKVVPILIESIKQLSNEVELLKKKLGE